MKKALFHINEAKKWETTINNIRNFILYYQQHTTPYEIVVVANGEAVARLEKKEINDPIGRLCVDLVEDGVCISVCNNTLNALKMTKDNLYDFSVVVPSGVVEIVDRQEKGFSYVKP